MRAGRQLHPAREAAHDFYTNTDFHQSFGGSAIINPFGEVVAGPVRDQETIVYADIDLKVNEMARGIVNITGIYSRWDILGLQVRTNQYEPLVSMESVEAGWPEAADLEAVTADRADAATPPAQTTTPRSPSSPRCAPRVAELEQRLEGREP